MIRPHTARLTAMTIALGLSLAACGTAETAGPAGDDGDETLRVLAAFYPLEFVTERIGGRDVTVEQLTPPGVEPHDVELSARQVRSVGEADVVVYLAGFQPAVEEALAARKPERTVDAAATPAVAEHLGEARHRGGAAAGQDTGVAGGADPHFWLDPTLLAAVARDVATTLAEADPANAADYAANERALVADLEALDAEMSAGLERCAGDVIVTSHESFGYLAERFGFQQVSVSGIDPEAEPSPARLRDIRATVQEFGVDTIFTEPLVNPKVAETLAADLGITTAVLDPIEGRPAGGDYRVAMERNLELLREGLRCA